MAFSTMIKQLREEKGLSQKDVAEYLGITRQAIASYELAKGADYDILHKLADFLVSLLTIYWGAQVAGIKMLLLLEKILI